METVLKVLTQDLENRSNPVEDRMNVLSQMQGSLLGLCLADAFGSEWESRSRAQILRETDGRGVTDFSFPAVRRREILDHPCEPTDDTQLTFALARSILRMGRVDLVDIARELVHEARRTRFGWGGTTKDAATAFGEWFDSDGREGRDPRVPVRPEGRPDRGYGTGVAMKIAPLALWHLMQSRRSGEPVDLTRLIDETMQIGLMTHSDPRASHAAVALVLTLVLAEQDPDRTLVERPQEFIERLLELLLPLEARTLDEATRESGHTMSDRLRRIDEGLTADLDTLVTLFPNTFSALDAVGLVVTIILRNPRDYHAAVLEAVNCGEDADTVACMVGATLGALLGLEAIPAAWRARVHPVCTEALALGVEMAALAT